MNLPTFNEIARANIKFITRLRPLPRAYPGYCAGAKETARRLKQIEAGKLQYSGEALFENVIFERQ